MSDEAATPATPSVAPEVLEAFERAQSMTIGVARAVAAQLREGMSEADIVGLLTDRAKIAGFTGWFHEPEVRFDAPIEHPLRASRKAELHEGTVVELDLAPCNAEAFGDFGVAFVFGGGPEPEVLSRARELVTGCCGFSNRWKCTGEVFVFAHAWANNHGYSLGDATAVGHRCLPPEGRVAFAWPRLARAATLMRRNQVEWYNHRRMSGLFALQPRLVVGQNGCSFEEMIIVDGDKKRILGRSKLEEVGTL